MLDKCWWLMGLVVAMGLVSCSRDPNVVKRRYLESGNKYFEKGKYKEAAIMYRDALQKDKLFGPAHYKLAVTWYKLGQIPGAVGEFRKAIERLPKEDADHWNAVVQLSEIYLAVARNQQYMEDVEGFTKQLLERDANSYDGHRLTGDLDFIRSQQAYSTARKDEGKQLLDQALVEYRKANSIKPNQQGVLMQMARVEAGEQDYPESEKTYRQVIAQDKTYEHAYTELYRLEMFQRKFDDGEQVLRLAFQNNPKQYAFLTALAQHYSLLRRRDDMIKVLGQIVSHAKDFDKAYLVVGDFYLRLNDAESAIHEYREGMTRDTKQKATYQKRIIEVLMREGKRADAAEINAQILKDNPNDNDAKGLAATMMLDRGDVTRALGELQAVVNRAPDNPVAHYNLARAHAMRQEWEQAREHFEKALELRPDYVLARLELAKLEVVRGDFDAALKSAQAALQFDRRNTTARLIESAALMGQRKFDDSRTLLGDMLKAAPNSPDVLFQLGVVDLSEKKYKEANDAFQHAYQLNPNNTRGLMGMVETAMAQNKPDVALGLLEAESAKGANRLDIKLAMGNTAVRAGKYDLAVQYFNSVLDSLDKGSKARGDVCLRIGETYRRKGDLGSAIAALQKARETLPDNVVVLSTLALVLDAAARWHEAQQVYDATLKLDPNNAVALNNDAFIMAEHGGDLDLALTMAQKAKQLLPNLTEVSDTMGWIYLKKNLSDNAIDIFRDLVKQQPQASTYRYHLGMALYQKGDKPNAIQELQTALKFNPPPSEREKIQEYLARLQ